MKKLKLKITNLKTKLEVEVEEKIMDKICQ